MRLVQLRHAGRNIGRSNVPVIKLANLAFNDIREMVFPSAFLQILENTIP